jgi:hypothetical protein
MATRDDDMNTKVMTNNEIRRTGIQVLTQSLGALGMVRFLQQTDLGWGDYTKERSQWLGNPSLDEIAAEINATRKSWSQQAE